MLSIIFFRSHRRERFNIEGGAFEVKPLCKLILQGVVRILMLQFDV